LYSLAMLRAGSIRFLPCLFAAALFVRPGAALAQANYDGALIGGRSNLMGGTGVAAGMDAAAPLQNPATTIGIEGTSFVFSTLAMQFSRRSIASDEQLTELVGRDQATLSDNQFNVLPNATCLFLDLEREGRRRKGAHKLSLCIAEPERSEFDLESSSLAVTAAGRGAFQSRFVRQVWSKKVYSAGWAYGLSEKLSLGITPMLQEVSFHDTEAVTTITSDATSREELVGSYAENATSVMTKDARSYGVSLLFGLQYRVASRWILGLSLETPSLALFGDYSASRSAESTTSDATEYMQDSGTARFSYPPRIAAGIAGALPFMTFELDAYFRAARQDFAEVESTREILAISGGTVTGIASDDVTERERVRPTLNVGVGVDVPFARNLSVISGLLTDFSGLEARRSGTIADATLFRSRVNAVHGSVGLAWTPRAGSLLFGIRSMYGKGELAVSDPRTLPTTRLASDQTLWGIALVVAGQLTLEMLALVDPTGLVKEAEGVD
jgi:hypothetical protein